MANTIRYVSREVAREYAKDKHGKQKYGNQPYVYHLDLAVAELEDYILPLPALRFYDHEVLIAATYLHDVLEDTETSAVQLAATFVAPVVELVQAVSDGPGKNRKERKAGVYAAIRRTGIAALAVKCGDRLANTKVCGLSKDPNNFMLKMYRKEQIGFEEELDAVASGNGWGPVFSKIHEYLGMDRI